MAQPSQNKQPVQPVETQPPIYPCVFNLSNHCPIRDHYKLRPESIILFCATCPVLFRAKKEMEYEILAGQGITNPSGR